MDKEQAMAVSDEMISFNGFRLHVMRKGSGEPLLWLHGANGNSQWLPLFDRLAEKFDVIVPEHPGFGRSDSSGDVKDMDDLVFLYRGLLDHLAIEKAHIVGQSLGGWLAAEFAVHQTHRVRKLVLTAAAGLYVQGAERVDSFTLDQDELAERTYHDPEKAKEAKARVQTDEAKDLFIKNRTAHARLAWERSFNPKLKKKLQWIDVPTLIVWGENDRVISPQHGRVYQESIPHAALRIIPQCGHVPYLEKTDEYADVLIDFITH